MGLFTPIDTEITTADIAMMKAKHEVFLYNEIIRILWGGQWYYYANAPFDVYPFSKIFSILGAVEIRVRLAQNWHAPFKISSIIEDNQTNFEFWDADDHFRDLHRLHGEGARLEIYGYWPDITASNPNGLLKSIWWGMLGQPDKSNPKLFAVQAKAGTRSPNMNLPHRIIYPGCSRVFGGQVNTATNQPFLNTPELVHAHACPYDRHLGGTVGNLEGAVPYKTCPRNNLKACKDRLGDTIAYQYYGGFDFIQATSSFTTRGHTYSANSNSNPSIIRSAIGVTYGIAMVGEIQPLIWQRREWFTLALWPLSEGPIEGVVPQWGIFYINIDDIWIVVDNSGKQQGVYGAGFTVPDFTYLGYSKTAYFYTKLPVYDFPEFDPTKSRARCLSNGLRVRIFTAPTIYTEAWSNNRAWCTFDLITAMTYGHGYDLSLFEMEDWINLAAWHNQLLAGPSGLVYDPTTGQTVSTTTMAKRSTLNVHLRDRSAQQVIKDICTAGHFGTPFFWNGKIRVVGLGLEDVSDLQKFTQEADTYNFRNIQPGSLKYTQKSDEELTNVLELKFTEQRFPIPTGHEVTDNDCISGVPPNFVEQTLVYDDQVQQLKAGLAMGNASLRVTKASIDALGVTNYHEAARLGVLIFDVGEQERGGLANNLSVSFKTWFPSSDGIQLHPYKLIEIMDAEVQKYLERPGFPFQYFRVQPTLTRNSDLTLDVETQAYPYQYYLNVEAGNYVRPLPVITRAHEIVAGEPISIPRPDGLTRDRDGLRIHPIVRR